MIPSEASALFSAHPSGRASAALKSVEAEEGMTGIGRRRGSAARRLATLGEPTTMTHGLLRGGAVCLLVLATGCGQEGEPRTEPVGLLPVPTTWTPVVQEAGSPWSSEELALLNAALYFVELSLPEDDPRRALMRTAKYVPFDQASEVDGQLPENAEAVFSIRTGSTYVRRPGQADLPVLASALAHELHHMERDKTDSVNRMQECDRERVAHAREAEDIGRMMALLRESSDGASRWLPALELHQAKVRALAGMYNAKFELFRLVQALDRVEGLREMPELYQAYELCIEVAERELATDHGEERRLLERLAAASRGSAAEAVTESAIQRAVQAVEACSPLQATVDRLRGASGTVR